MAVRAPLSPYAVLTAAAFLLASDVVVGRLAEGTAPPLVLDFFRCAGAAVLLLPFVGRELLSQRFVIAAAWRHFALVDLFGSIVGAGALYTGLAMTTALNGGIVTTTQSALTVMIAWLAFGERIGRGELAGLVVAAAGVLYVVVGGDSARLAAFQPHVGDLFVLVGVAGFAAYVVWLRRLPAGMSSMAALCVIMWWGSAFLAPAVVAEMLAGRVFVASAKTVGLALWSSIAVGIFAVGCLTAGTRMVGSYQAGAFNYLRTVFSLGLAIALLGERPQLYHGVGLVLSWPACG
ncbi:MAG: DMT family transporter [Alphaproteobacteria bacterium]|nr:DMT family transporter [Alphaproteobacteria bacterium]